MALERIVQAYSAPSTLFGMTYAAPPPYQTTNGEGYDEPLPGATFGQAVSRYYRRYATFSGRASRSEYWWAVLFVTLVYLAFGALTVTVGVLTADSSSETSGPPPLFVVVALLAAVFTLANIVPGLALNSRRLHDANLSGWMQLVYVVPSIGPIVMIVLAMQPSSSDGAHYDKGIRPVGS